jgi:glycosyltransferase involved in cell wall biosynthesis
VAALNTGLSATTGRFVARIDADDRYRPCFFEATLPLLEARPHVGLVYGDVALCDPEGTILEEPYAGIASHARHNGRDTESDEFLPLVNDYVVPCAAIMTRGDLLRRCVPIPSWFEWASPSDWYLTLQMARRAPVAYRARVLADYRTHGTNMNVHARHAPADGSAERTIIRTLDDLFGNPECEPIPSRDRRRAYARSYETEGNRYFEYQQWGAARRCYWNVLWQRPAAIFEPGLLRHLAATFSPGAYARLSSGWRTASERRLE